MNTPIPLHASNRPRQAILFFLLLMLGNLTAQAQNNWTGNTNRNWNTAGNWSAGIPTATSDVVIPSAPANQPVLSTTATAKSVEVQAGASLSISNSGSLTLNGSKSSDPIFSTAFLNRGTVGNSGQVVIGNSPSASVGDLGIRNEGTFQNNSGGSIAIDRTTSTGLLNAGGSSFSNSATITIGAVASVGEQGILNQATFANNTGGSITIDQISLTGLINNRSFTNSAQITIRAGRTGILNGATNSTFQNTGCAALINIVADAFILNIGTFSNGGTIIENATGNSSISSNAGLVQNLNGGTFTITGTNTGLVTTIPGSLPVITATPSLTITQGQSTTLTASGALSYSWSTGETTPAITVSATGPYSVTGTTGGCSSKATVNMTVVPTFTVSNPAICPGQFVNLGNYVSNKSPITGDLTYYTSQANAQAGTNALISGLVGPVNVPVTYYVRYDAAGSFSIQPIMVTLKPALPAPPVLTQNGHAYTDGVASITVAQNSESVILAVPGCDGTVSWSGPNNFISFNPTISVPTSNTGSFTYSASCSSQTACFSGSSQATVTVNVAVPVCGQIVYVTPGGAGSQNGSSWGNAFAGTGLQTAISTAAGCGAQVWVAAGLYKPTTTTDRSISFSMANGVAIYGGFAGNEAANYDLSLRNLVTNQTTLSGDIDGSGTLANNSYHVIVNPRGLTASAILDGFLITGGNANGNPNIRGGGVLNQGGNTNNACSPTFRNCLFRANSAVLGGAMYNQAGGSGTSSPVLINCSFQDNSASQWGGAMLNDGFDKGTSSPVLINCSFQGNSASANGGGALYNEGEGNGISLPMLTNCVVFGNGGANTFFNNRGTTGVSATYSLFDDAVTGYNTGGTGNLTTAVSPFVSASSVVLTACSAAINVGDPSTTTATVGATDLAGSNRIVGGRVDMGAVEYQGNLFSVSITANPSLTITQGQSTILTALGADSYRWASGETTAAISVSVAGPYSVTGMTTAGCSSVASVTVTVNALVCGAGLSGPIWTGCVSTDWNTAGNWASGAIPTATDDVVIPAAPANQPVLSTTATAQSVEVQTGASLSISSAGRLTINGSKNIDGFTTAFSNRGMVQNAGLLILGNTADVGAFAIWNRSSFTNNGGEIRIDRTTNQGINNNVGLFTNTGTITIGALASVGQQGILNQAAFANTGGTITIDRTTSDGLLNSGNFVNSATITIGASAPVTGNGIANAGTFSNSACARLTVVAPINNTNTFTNAGLFTISTTRLHSNTGTLTNNGLISYPQGNPIPNVVNNDVVVAPISSCNTAFSPALQLGGNNAQFTVGTTWYTDQALTQSGGTYDPTTNTFTATNLAQGSSRTLYFTATDNANGCPRTLSISVTASAIASLSITANPSLTITQGNSTVLTASGADSFRWSSGQSTSAISVSVAGPYSVTGTTGSCSATASVTLTVNPPACGAGLSGPIWTGCVSTDWNTAGNWASGAVPTATDDVVIPAAPSNQPVINTSVVAGSVRINSGGLLTINASASLATNQSFIDGTLVNYGILTVTAGTRTQDCLYNTGLVQNKSTGTIRLNGAYGNGIWNVTDGSNVTNDGTIIIGDNTMTGSSGILNYGTLINTATGTIQIDNSRVNALVNTKTVSNAGLIRIGIIVPPTGIGIVNVNNSSTNPDPVFTNAACGVIEVLALVINQNGTFTNNGLLTVNTPRSQRVTVVRVNSPAGLAKTFSFGTAQFGALINSVNLTADAVLVSDGTADATLGCNPPVNSAQLAGKIAVVDRGICNFSQKVYYAQQAGAIAVVVLNNQPGDVTMGAGAFADQITIPAVIVSQTDGQAIKTALATGPVNIGINQEFPVVAGTTNNGVINYVQGNSPIPNVTNNDVIAAPISSCSNTFSPALQLGGNNAQFTVGTTWYTDQALTQPAGTYNQGTNTFIATNLAPGSNTLLYFAAIDNTNNCIKTVAVSVTGNQSVTAVISPSSATLTCASPTVSLTASGGSRYVWDDNSINAIRTVSASGLYSVTAISANGCSAVSSVSVSQDNSATTASLVSSGTLSCAVTSVTLTANPGGSSYVFSAGASQIGSSNNAVVSEAGPYSVTVILGNGCSAVASVVIGQDNTAPSLTITPSSATLTCANPSVSLTAVGSGTVRWDDNSTNAIRTVSTSGTYSVTVVSANGCSAVASTIVSSFTEAPVVNLVSSGSLNCSVTSVTLTASPSGLSYIFSAGATQLGSTNQATVSTPGLYSVTVLSGNGCSSVASTSVSQNNTPPQVSISANPSLTIIQGQTTTLTATSPIALTSYAWSTSQTTPAISVSTAATYSVTVTSASGCSATNSVVVSTTMAPVANAPFAITAITTVDCTPVLPNRYSISFTPRYAGLTGQPIAFSITNELLPTSAPGPYTLQLYTDNPILLVKATQAGSPAQSASFSYNWLAACQASVSSNTPPRVMMNIPPQSATVGVGFSYVIPLGTFTDDQTPGSLMLTTSGLPAGLSLSGYTISGTPSSTVGSPFSVSITATDPGGLSVATSFVLRVSPAPSSPPVSSGVFSITGVSLLRCTPVADRINISFAPQYAGLNGQGIAFRVENELAPTTDPAPYSLTLYRDNPVIRLRATQTGSVGEASFDYNWLVGCASMGSDNTAPRVVNPVGSQTATVGAGYGLNLSNVFVDQETPTGLVLTASGLPAGLSLVGTAISGTPSVSGTSTITVMATDPGSLSVATSFMLVVSPAVSQTTTPPVDGACSASRVFRRWVVRW